MSRLPVKWIGLVLLMFFFSQAAWGQNTKGDRPIKNNRQVRETRVKSVRKKESRRTKDIANRRLRTRNQSSANRANANIRQPSTTTRQARSNQERRAAPRGRTFTRSPRESKTKPWRGDISGHAIRRVRPNHNEAARDNVYPQKNIFVKGYQKRPKEESTKRIVRNTKGRRVGQQKPQRVERKWSGGIDRGPIRNRSVSASIKKVYEKPVEYVKYARKHKTRRETRASNSRQLGRLNTIYRQPAAGYGSGGGTYSLSRPFIQRGKKNVYWGKFRRTEKRNTRDITGGPLRTRNFKTQLPGRVGRDTLQFFGRKPKGERAARSGRGYATATQSGRGWQGDISGWKLRGGKGRSVEKRGQFFFPRLLSISKRGDQRGGAVSGSGFKTSTRRGERKASGNPSRYFEQNLGGNIKGIRKAKGGGSISGQQRDNRRLAVRAPGIGAAGLGNYRGSGQPRGGFSRTGTGFSGNLLRRAGFSRNGANYSGNIKRSTITGYNRDGVDYSGRMKRSSVSGYNRDGVDYSGRIKRSSITGYNRDGVDYAGRIKRSQQRGFSKQGLGFSGNLRRSNGFGSNGANFSGHLKLRRPEHGGGSISGRSWNNGKKAVTVPQLGPNGMRAQRYTGNIFRVGAVKQFEENGVGYSGRIRRSSQTGYGEQGTGFAGNIRLKRKEKGGGSVSGVTWNNQRKPLPPRSFESIQGMTYAGNIKRRRPDKGGGSVSGVTWNNDKRPLAQRTFESIQGMTYAGNIKRRRPEKGGGSVSGVTWNNDKKPLAQRTFESIQGMTYAGNIKRRRPEKGGGSVSGVTWNNDKKPLAQRTFESIEGMTYAGNIKRRRPEKGGGSVSGVSWNNDKKPIEVRVPLNGRAAEVGYSGRIATSRFKKNYVRNPNADDEALKTKRPDRTTYLVAGLQVKMREKNYKQKPNADPRALPGIAPTKSSVRASEYARSMKQVWRYKHNPNSADGALDVIAPGKAMARIRDYQGNIKMHKYRGPLLHPDAKFAHGFQDNVKGERTFLMNVQLFWSKLFHKNDTQPVNLKEKIRRPRYDKREKGLWNEPSRE